MLCSNCSAELPDKATQQETFTYVRSFGWHVWSGVTMGGQQVTRVLCRKCIKIRQYDRPPVEPMKGQPTLFDEE